MALPEMPDLTTLGYITALAVVNWFISGRKGKSAVSERRDAFSALQTAMRADFTEMRQYMAVSQAQTKAEFTAVNLRLDEFCTRLDTTAVTALKADAASEKAVRLLVGEDGANGLRSRVLALEKSRERRGEEPGRRTHDQGGTG